MKILVTGAAGQLGYDLIRELKTRGHETIGTDLKSGEDIVPADITDKNAVRALIMSNEPDAVVHCASWTQVDAAEEPENTQKVYDINVNGTANIADICAQAGIKLMYISTDYVFDGEKGSPYETGDLPRGLGMYGLTKAFGETEVAGKCRRYFTVRISGVFGEHGQNFVKTMLRLAGERESISVVNDQVFSPTYTVDLSGLLADMIETDRFGTYHATNEGFCSWYDFAKEIMRQGKALGIPGCDPDKIQPTDTASYNSRARRPLDSRLSKDCLEKNGFKRLPAWQDALGRFLEHYKGA